MKIICPHCNIQHDVICANTQHVPKVFPDYTPFFCGHCSAICFFMGGRLTKASEDQLKAIKESPVYRDFFKLAEEARKAVNN